MESAGICVPDEKLGERGLMIVTLKEYNKDKTTSEDLTKFMQKLVTSGKLPKYGIPERFVSPIVSRKPVSKN